MAEPRAGAQGGREQAHRALNILGGAWEGGREGGRVGGWEGGEGEGVRV